MFFSKSLLVFLYKSFPVIPGKYLEGTHQASLEFFSKKHGDFFNLCKEALGRKLNEY
jgi:hypothetical protein